MSVTLQVDWRMQEMRVLLTTVLIFPKDHGHRAPTLTALRAAILVQMYRVWPVDEFQILLRSRGQFGRGLPPR